MIISEISQAHADNYLELLEVWEASVRATHHFITEQDICFFKALILDEYFAQLSLYSRRALTMK